MSASMTADISKLKARIASYTANMADARMAALVVAVNPAATEILAKTPVDTHRLKRGFAMAFNQMGLPPRVVPEISESKRKWKKQKKLVRQLMFLNFVVSQFEQKFPLDRGETKLYQKYYQWRDRAKEELEKFSGDSIVVINKGRGVEITVRNKVYGGRGAVIEGDRFTRLEGVNLEPHASIRERTDRNVTTALASAKGVGGVKTTRGKYLAAIIKRENRTAARDNREQAKVIKDFKARELAEGRAEAFKLPDWLDKRLK